MLDAGRIALVRNEARQALGMPSAALSLGEEHDAAVGRQAPGSKAAVIFLRPTAGNRNVAVVQSGMAGEAA
ncbi:hypothetical protein ACH79_27460 [Bradyrhizobium sp. CCBAU 051011]|nr:hypothetical protein ACH79_27460 [Bradyrhizobium sp. CCBAU 051011]